VVCRWKLKANNNITILKLNSLAILSTQCSDGCQCVLCNFQWFLFSIISVTVLYLEGGRFFRDTVYSLVEHSWHLSHVLLLVRIFFTFMSKYFTRYSTRRTVNYLSESESEINDDDDQLMDDSFKSTETRLQTMNRVKHYHFRDVWPLTLTISWPWNPGQGSLQQVYGHGFVLHISWYLIPILVLLTWLLENRCGHRGVMPSPQNHDMIRMEYGTVTRRFWSLLLSCGPKSYAFEIGLYYNVLWCFVLG